MKTFDKPVADQNQTRDYPERRLGLIMAGVAGLCWAVLAIGLKVALDFSSSGSIVWVRMSGAFLILAVILGIQNRENFRILKAMPVLGVISATGLAINYFGFMKGVELTSPSNAQVFIQLAPMLLILTGIFAFRERPQPLQILGFVLTAVGFAIFFKDQLDHVAQELDRFTIGNLWIVLAAVTWVVFASLQKLLLQKWSPQQINLLVYGLSTLMLLPLANWQDFVSLSWPQALLLLALALNTVIAYGALGIALQKAPASQVSVVITLNPLLTLTIMEILGILQVNWIRADHVDPLGWMGASIVVIGIILAITNQKSQTSHTRQTSN